MNEQTMEKHSVNCYFCNDLVDERECMEADLYNGNDGGDICPKCLSLKERKHTPGPWRIVEDGHQYEGELTGGAHLIENPDIGSIAVMIDTDDSEVCDANAHLIAAAPDMLEALKGVQEYLAAVMNYATIEQAREWGDKHWKSIDKIITKVEAKQG